MWFTVASLAFPVAAAADACDVKPLQAEFAETSPAGAGAVYARIAECDPGAAKAMAATAFQKIIGGEGGNTAALAAIKGGSGEVVRTWITGLASDDRSPTLAWLGNQCSASGVPTFFVDAEKAMGASFYNERWFAALATCRHAAVQTLLQGAVDRAKNDRMLYPALLSTYARNVGKASIPYIEEHLKTETDATVVIDLVGALPDAAGVGSPGGANADAVTVADAALTQVAARLPEKSMDAVRAAFLSLGDEPAADGAVAMRYKSLLQPEGGLLYGVVAVENATCKKGDTRIEIHTAPVKDTGHTWPDQLLERVDPAARAAFDLDLAENCKGTSKISFTVPEAPFKDAAAYKLWVDKALAELQKSTPAVTPKVYPADPISL